MARKRRPQPNYYLRKDARRAREEEARRAARHPDTLAARLLESIDVDRIAEAMSGTLDGTAFARLEQPESNENPEDEQRPTGRGNGPQNDTQEG